MNGATHLLALVLKDFKKGIALEECVWVGLRAQVDDIFVVRVPVFLLFLALQKTLGYLARGSTRHATSKTLPRHTVLQDVVLVIRVESGRNRVLLLLVLPRQFHVLFPQHSDLLHQLVAVGTQCRIAPTPSLVVIL